MRGNRLVAVEYGRCELRDSWAILPAPLRAHDKGEIDYSLFEKGKREKHKQQILEYLSRDVVSLHKWVMEFIKTHGLVLTAAQASLRSLHKLCGVKTPKFSPWMDAEFRKYYFGGRNTPWQTGIFKGDFLYLDLNSAYPWAMTLPHPFSDQFSASKKVCEQSMVTVEGVAKGCFPLRVKGQSTPYPSDNVSRVYHVTGWEYLAARELDLFKGKVLASFNPEHVRDFSPFVRYWHGKKSHCKKVGDKSGELVAKISVNSGYGKFAQKPVPVEQIVLAPPDVDMTSYDGKWREKICDSEGGYSVWALETDQIILPWNVVTAASITGCVRARIVRAKAKCRNALYTDTDSLIVPADEGEKLIGQGLGQWELKAKTGGKKRVVIAGKKLYAFETGENQWMTASKGVQLSADEIIEVARGKTVVWKNDAPTFSLSRPTSNPVFMERKISKKSA
jgi:hypothetical protein